ncbi:MAG TPA: hypothetical protein VL651_05970 [Bacteroidia bacterium]|jgi:hypothetical protein|nr:hypothetical protein [Bacteroidia bacterium]
MRPFFTTLFVICILTFTSTDLFADKFPKSNSHASFKACPVNARAGKRASVRMTHIRSRKVKHTGVHTYTVSSTPTHASAPASGGSGAPANIDDAPTSTDASGTGAAAPAPAPPANTNVNDNNVNVDLAPDQGDSSSAPVQDVPISNHQNSTINNVAPPRSQVDYVSTTTTNVQAVPINKQTDVQAPRTAAPRTTTKPVNTASSNTSTGSGTKVPVSNPGGRNTIAPVNLINNLQTAPTSAPNTTVNTSNVVPVSNLIIPVIHN